MKNKLFLSSLIILLQVISAFSQSNFKLDWNSQKHETPTWFQDAKFGIYCHFGPYCVPAYSDWYSTWMYMEGSKVQKYHEQKYGTLDKFGYKDFIPMFKAEKFNAEEWADLFEKAGAKFAGTVTEHADGFAMWDSKLTPWNCKNMGPNRDITGELVIALRKRGLKYVSTSHRSWLFAWYPTWDSTTDASKPEFAGLYGPKVPKGAFEMAVENPKYLADKNFNDEWLARLKEIIDKYSPDLMYFDNKLNIISEQHRKEFLNFYYKQAAKKEQEVVVTYKFHDLPVGTAVLDLERSRMSEKKVFPWLTDDSIDWEAWNYVSNPHWKSTNRIIDFLIDVVSKNGCLLLNVTPMANGEMPDAVKERLIEIGNWLKINGESIYGTRTWKVYGEGPTKVVEGHLSEEKNNENTEKDIRFTQKGDVLYASVLDIPKEEIKIKSLASISNLIDKKIKSVSLLGSVESVIWKQSNEALVIQPPKSRPCEYAIVFKILFEN